jgi:hypothetical protein
VGVGKKPVYRALRRVAQPASKSSSAGASGQDPAAPALQALKLEEGAWIGLGPAMRSVYGRS